jgi:hypothetical protein
MQDLSLQSPPSSRKITISLPRCGSTRVEAIRFVAYSDPSYCRDCPGHYSGCWKMEMAYKDISESEQGKYYALDNKYAVCVDMSSELVLQDEKELVPNSDCELMSSTPCTNEDEADCTTELSNIPESVFKYGDASSPARYETLGMKQDIYELELRKSIAVCPISHMATCPAIRICARNPYASS